MAAAIDVLFRESNTASGWALCNPRVRAVTRAVIALVRGRIDAHDQSGDPGAVLVRLAGQMFTGHAAADPGVLAIAAIADDVGEVDRRHPGIDLGAAWAAADFASVRDNVAGFLREQQRGLPRFRAGQEPVSQLTVLSLLLRSAPAPRRHGPAA